MSNVGGVYIGKYPLKGRVFGGKYEKEKERTEENVKEKANRKTDH
jgi:hypothetical protein